MDLEVKICAAQVILYHQSREAEVFKETKSGSPEARASLDRLDHLAILHQDLVERDVFASEIRALEVTVPEGSRYRGGLAYLESLYGRAPTSQHSPVTPKAAASPPANDAPDVDTATALKSGRFVDPSQRLGQIDGELAEIRATLDRPGPEPSQTILRGLSDRMEALGREAQLLLSQPRPRLSKEVRDLPSSAAAPTTSGVEYRRVAINWTKENLGNVVGKTIYQDSDFDRWMVIVEQMVMHYLRPYFEAGWRLDGSYNDAVEYLYEDAWLGLRRRLAKALIRLRRGG